jgi:hypothetical protein
VLTLSARPDEALSVVMTTMSTLALLLLTPLLAGLLAGLYVHVDVWKLLLDMLQVVLLPPLMLGVALKRGAPKLSRRPADSSPAWPAIDRVWHRAQRGVHGEHRRGAGPLRLFCFSSYSLACAKLGCEPSRVGGRVGMRAGPLVEAVTLSGRSRSKVCLRGNQSKFYIPNSALLICRDSRLDPDPVGLRGLDNA